MKDIKWIFALGGLVILFFFPLLSPNSIMYPGEDVIGIFAPEKHLFANTIHNLKTIPLWNPYIFSGSPFVGNPTSAMFYPFSLLYLLLPVEYAFSIIFILDIFLLGIFSFFYTKTIIKNSRLSFFAATIIMLSGSFVCLLNAGHIINLDTFIWFPLSLFFVESFLLNRKVQFLLYAGISVALLLLAGASQIAIYGLTVIFFYISLRTF